MAREKGQIFLDLKVSFLFYLVVVFLMLFFFISLFRIEDLRNQRLERKSLMYADYLVKKGISIKDLEKKRFLENEISVSFDPTRVPEEVYKISVDGSLIYKKDSMVEEFVNCLTVKRFVVFHNISEKRSLMEVVVCA